MNSATAPSSLLLALVLVLGGSAAACRPRVPPPELPTQGAMPWSAVAEYDAALADLFRAKANEYAADAGNHRRLADATTEGTLLWERHHDRSLLRLADHCTRAAENLTAAGGELRELAREHQEIAQKVREQEERTR